MTDFRRHNSMTDVEEIEQVEIVVEIKTVR